MKQNDKLNEVSKPIIFNSHVNKRNWDILVIFLWFVYRLCKYFFEDYS